MHFIFRIRFFFFWYGVRAGPAAGSVWAVEQPPYSFSRTRRNAIRPGAAVNATETEAGLGFQRRPGTRFVRKAVADLASQALYLAGQNLRRAPSRCNFGIGKSARLICMWARNVSPQKFVANTIGHRKGFIGHMVRPTALVLKRCFTP